MLLNTAEGRAIYKIRILGKANKERYIYIPQEQIEIELEYLKSFIHNYNLTTQSLAIVRTHPIWPPCALALGQLTHEHLARLRIDYVASQESVMRS